MDLQKAELACQLKNEHDRLSAALDRFPSVQEMPLALTINELIGKLQTLREYGFTEFNTTEANDVFSVDMAEAFSNIRDSYESAKAAVEAAITAL